MNNSPNLPWRAHEKTSYDADALRGLAALGVVVYHFSLAFLSPRGFGAPVLPPFLNGTFCVMIFFVLSSFVLTNHHLTNLDRHTVIRAMLKRWPRLLPLTIIGTILPAMLYIGGYMENRDTAALIGSQWLDRSAGIKNWGNDAPSLLGGMKDGIRVYAKGLSQYNSAMWTMKWELIGSLFALASAMMIGSRHRPRTDAAILTPPLVLGYALSPLVAVCVSTVFLTKYVLWRPTFLSRGQALACISVGLLCAVPYGVASARLMQTLYGIGATILFIGVRNLPTCRDREWSVGRFFGRISFALYVVHLPVLASISSMMVGNLGDNHTSFALASGVGIGVSIGLAWGLAFFDQWWMNRLKSAFSQRSRIGSLVQRIPVRRPATVFNS